MTTRLLLFSLWFALFGCLTRSTDDDDSSPQDDDDAIEEPVLCIDYDGCHLNAACEDTAEGPVCTCEPGWEGDGQTCDDVDECLMDNGGCDANATCSNVDGGRDCDCNDGWSGDGLTCEELLPYWEPVASSDIVWEPKWAPETVVVWGTTIVWGTETAAGTDSTLHRFDTANSTFSDFGGGTADLCACGYVQASVVAGNHLYLFGNEAARLDLSAAAPLWEDVAMPSGRRRGEAGVAVLGDDIYLFGGRGPETSTQVYSGGAAGSWTDATDIPYPVDYARPVVVGSDIYLLGGVNEAATESRASRFTPSTGAWQILTSPPVDEGRTVGAGRLGEQLWMLQREEIYFYDPTTDAWDPASISTPMALSRPHVVTFDGVIHAIGGEGAGTGLHRLVFP